MRMQIKIQNYFLLSFLNTIRSIILTLSLVLCFIGGQAQTCDSIVLNNQEDINNFIKNYGHCTSIRDLVITNRDNDITQLDSLYTIERITGSLRFSNQLQGGREVNISAFKRLRYLNTISVSFPIILIGQFLNLDSIGTLGIANTSYTYTYPNLKHIEYTLAIRDAYLTEDNVPAFTTGKNFFLSLGNVDTSTLKVLAKNIKTENLKKLTIAPYYGSIDLSYLPILDSVEILKIGICKNSNLRQISKIRKLKWLSIDHLLEGNDFGDGLIHIKELDELFIHDGDPNIANYRDYNIILPNLEAINELLFIANTDSLFNLDFLDKVRPPLASTPPNPIYGPNPPLINIHDNLYLNYCKSIFLCKAIKQYPDRIYLKNNYGSKCTLEDLAKICETVSTDDKHIKSLTISPNPTYGIVQLSATETPVHIRIYNIQGTIVKTLYNCTAQIDIADLPSGLYVFDIAYNGRTEKHKIVKMD